MLYLEGDFLKEFIKISSKDNNIFKYINLLKTSTKERKESGLFILEGKRICKDALDNGIAFSFLAVNENALKKYKNEIDEFSKNSEKLYLFSDNLFEKISDTKSPQGILAVGKIPQKNEVINRNGKYIALENIQDPSNLGAVSRTAEALGVSGIILSENGCDPYSPKVLRSSMGTLLRLPVFMCNDIIEFSKKNSLRTIACVVDKNATDIKDFSFKNGDVLLIGNEGNGLLSETVNRSNFKITIKMTGSIESLNAAIAASLSMWEMMK